MKAVFKYTSSLMLGAFAVTANANPSDIMRRPNTQFDKQSEAQTEPVSMSAEDEAEMMKSYESAIEKLEQVAVVMGQITDKESADAAVPHLRDAFRLTKKMEYKRKTMIRKYGISLVAPLEEIYEADINRIQAAMKKHSERIIKANFYGSEKLKTFFETAQ